jgi:outer membrane protein OmpA-like peptidoglycan-associated protein
MELNQNKDELEKTNRMGNVEEKFLVIEWLVKNEMGSPLDAQVAIVAEGDSTVFYQINAGGNGRASVELPYGQNFIFTSRVKGYFNESGTINYKAFSGDNSQTISLLHKEMPTGITETLPNIMFEQGLDKLLDVAYPELDSLAGFLISHPSVRIKLDGHTDAIGDPQLNIELSLMRVEMVKSYLVGAGVEAQRIELEAFGGSKPIASNASERTRRLNRRVEWTIIEN